LGLVSTWPAIAVNQDNGKCGARAARRLFSEIPLRHSSKQSLGVINKRQEIALRRHTVFVMVNLITISDVVRDGEDGLIVTFSDGTTGGYVVEELLMLRPVRQPIQKPKANKVR